MKLALLLLGLVVCATVVQADFPSWRSSGDCTAKKHQSLKCALLRDLSRLGVLVGPIYPTAYLIIS